MKLRLPKTFYAAVLAAAVASQAHAATYEQPLIGDQHTVLQWNGNASSSATAAESWVIAGTQNAPDSVFDHQVNSDDSEAQGGARQWLKFEGRNVEVPGGNIDIELVGSGLMVTGEGTSVSLSFNRWLGDIIVGEGASLDLTMGNASYIKSINTTPSISTDATVYVEGAMTVHNLKLCIRQNWGSQDQNWYIGSKGQVTLDGVVTLDTWGTPHAWNLQVKTVDEEEGNYLNRQRTELERTVISTINGADISSTAINISLYDGDGNAIALSDDKIVRDASGLKVKYLGYAEEDLVWNYAENAVWDHAAGGFHIEGDSNLADTAFLNGDNATFNTAGSVTIGTAGVTAGTVNVTANTTFTGGVLSVQDAFNVAEGVEATISSLQQEAVFVKEGEGKLIITNKGNLVDGKLVINAGTVKLATAAEWLPHDSANDGLGTLKGATIDIHAGATLELVHDALGYGGKQVGTINMSGTEGSFATIDNHDREEKGCTLQTNLNMNGYSTVTGGAWNTFGGDITATNDHNTFECDMFIRNNITFTVSGAGDELTVSGKFGNSTIDSNSTGTVTKAGNGTLVLTNAEGDYSRAFNVTAGTLRLVDGAKTTTGSLTISSGATLAYAGDAALAPNVTFVDGAKLLVEKGALTINNSLDASGIEIKVGANGNTGKLKLAEGVELTYDGLVYRGTSEGSEISSSANVAVSVWHNTETLKNLEIDFDQTRDVKANLDNVTINAKSGSTVRLQATQDKVKALNVDNGGNVNADGYRATVTGDSLIDGNVVVTGAGASLTLQGTTTITANGQLHDKDDRTVRITARPAVSRAAGEAVLENVTVAVGSLSGESSTKKGVVSDGSVVLKGDTAVSHIDFENSLVDLSAATSIEMNDVVFGTGTRVSGSGAVSVATVKLSALELQESTVDKSDLENGVLITYTGLGGLAFSDSFTLELSGDFMTALQRKVMPDSTDVLKISFGDGVTIADTAALAVSVQGGYPALGTPAIGLLEGGHGVQINFAETDAIPEPATATLSLLALAGLAARRRRKTK